MQAAQVRQQDWATTPTFNIQLVAAPQQSYLSAFLSWSIVAFYGPLALAVIAVVLITGHVYGRLL